MPRPTIQGNIRRVIDMNHRSAGKNKDYRITISEVATDQYRVYTEHGPAGRLNNGGELTTASVDWFKANSMADNARDAKKKQGDSYQVTSDKSFGMPAPAPAPKASPRKKRKLISAKTLSPASRAALNVIF